MKTLGFFLFILIFNFSLNAQERTVSITDYGVQPNSKINATPTVFKLIHDLKNKKYVTIIFPKGRYDFYEDGSATRTYYISNHDQDNPKKVIFPLEGLKNITIDGQGSEFVFHGRMVPFAIRNAENITLQNFSIDYEHPAMLQLKVVSFDDKSNTLTTLVEADGQYELVNGKLTIKGDGFLQQPESVMVFDADRHMAYRLADLPFNPKAIIAQKSTNILELKDWDQSTKLKPGQRLVLRGWERPTPGIFIDESKNTTLKKVTVHFAEGMGLIAQMSENIKLDHFQVALKGPKDPRYFTTQADATHFSADKGLIDSQHGLYEGMADDAINVHGTYLRIIKRVNDHTLQAKYMHPQTYGFKWGDIGDTVQIIQSKWMQNVGNKTYRIQSIKPVDQPTVEGAKIFEISFDKNLPQEVKGDHLYAIENLTWTPSVIFRGNTIRNNRARGSLFSTHHKVLVENNLYDHTHGSAILIAGDANGWFETGPVMDILIRRNRFINALTANYQFTNAIISIDPEIPDLKDQTKYYHHNIRIEDNYFDTFDRPLVYAKSVDGLTFKDNTIHYNNDYPAFHQNHYLFNFERVKNVRISRNKFPVKFNPEKDILIKLSPDNAINLKQD